VSAGALAAIEALLERGEDADEVLRGVVDALVGAGCAWAGILFVEGGELILGPEAGRAAAAARIELPVSFRGTKVATLAAEGCEDERLLAQVAALIAPYCLVGWDTGGIPWEEAGR
jgi:hypothetical protein